MGKIKTDGNLIDLQAAHVTQYTDNNKKGSWLIRQNITSKDLFELPGKFSEKEVFMILDFARKFELLAFNVGIGYAKQLKNQVLMGHIELLKNKLKLAAEENERLATALEKHIISEE